MTIVLVFICSNCTRPRACRRDTALREWGERGVIADVAKTLRCRNCGGRGMSVALAPVRADLGSPPPQTDLERLVEVLKRIKPSGTVS